jgi:hypothetical protein
VLDRAAWTRFHSNVDAEVSAALIAAIGAVGVALVAAFGSFFTLVRQGKFAKELEEHRAALARREKGEERALTAKAELDRVREPLLHVALDLGDRLNNIRNNAFLAYLESSNEWRRNVAATGTLYRLARYWCVVESLYDRTDLSKLRAESSTRDVAAKLSAIGSTFADDRHDQGRLMMWREEQRAIAERARDERAAIGCIGFASFVDRYEAEFAQWFDILRKDLPSADSSERLRLVQQHLAELAEQLAPEGVQFYRERIEKLKRGAADSQ